MLLNIIGNPLNSNSKLWEQSKNWDDGICERKLRIIIEEGLKGWIPQNNRYFYTNPAHK